MSLSEAEQKLGYTFKDKSILKRALTLASADGVNNNQSLEFFGDAILEFIVSECIFDEGKTEGQLTEIRKALVSDKALTPVSEKLGLEKYLIKSVNDGNNKKSVPSAYEAVVAAIYLDGGIDAARSFVLRTMDFNAPASEENFKGELQEFLQSKGRECPSYKREDVGTPQKPEFQAEVKIFGKTFKGTAGNVRQAEQNAAKAAMDFIKDNYDNF